MVQSTKYHVRSTRYEIRNQNNVECGTLNAQCRKNTKYQVGIRIGIRILFLKNLRTLYLVLGTMYFVL